MIIAVPSPCWRVCGADAAFSQPAQVPSGHNRRFGHVLLALGTRPLLDGLRRCPPLYVVHATWRLGLRYLLGTIADIGLLGLAFAFTFGIA
jgi:hypothetical protein